MSQRVAVIVLAGLLAACVTGCGSSGHEVTTTTTTTTTTSTAGASSVDGLAKCLQRHGYVVTPESPGDVETAPARFEFTEVWNVLNPSRIALALTFSRSVAGAREAATWTRRTNARIGRGAVIAPVARIGKIDVLWTAQPDAAGVRDVYACVKKV